MLDRGDPLRAENGILLRGKNLLQRRRQPRIQKIIPVTIQHPIDVEFVDLREMRDDHLARRGEFRTRNLPPLCQAAENRLRGCYQRVAPPLRQRRRDLFQIPGLHFLRALLYRRTAGCPIQPRPHGIPRKGSHRRRDG